MVYFNRGRDQKTGKNFVMVQVIANKEFLERHRDVYWDLRFVPEETMKFFGPVLDEDMNIAFEVIKNDLSLDSLSVIKDKDEIARAKSAKRADKLILIEFGEERYLVRKEDQRDPRRKKIFADIETNLTAFMDLYTSQFKTR